MKHLLLALGLLASPILAGATLADTPAQPSRPGDARLVPVVRDGQPVGLKVYGIRAGGRFAVAGFANGDMIETVDGHAVTGDEGARRLHDSLVAAKTGATVVVQRRGKAVTLTVRAP